MKSWYYLPCRTGRVRRVVEFWRWFYGRNPEFIGRVDLYETSGFRYFQGLVYVGLIPEEDISLFPNCRRLTLRDFNSINRWIDSRWTPELTCDLWDLEDAEEELEACDAK